MVEECSDRIGWMLLWLKYAVGVGVNAGCANEFTADCADTYQAGDVPPELPSEKLLEEVMDRRVSSQVIQVTRLP